MLHPHVSAYVACLHQCIWQVVSCYACTQYASVVPAGVELVANLQEAGQRNLHVHPLPMCSRANATQLSEPSTCPVFCLTSTQAVPSRPCWLDSCARRHPVVMPHARCLFQQPEQSCVLSCGDLCAAEPAQPAHSRPAPAPAARGAQLGHGCLRLSPQQHCCPGLHE